MHGEEPPLSRSDLSRCALTVPMLVRNKTGVTFCDVAVELCTTREVPFCEEVACSTEMKKYHHFKAYHLGYRRNFIKS